MQDLLEYLQEQLRRPGLGSKLTGQYRRDAVKAIINSYPPNTPIPLREVQALLGIPRASVYTLIHNAKRDGHIQNVGPKRHNAFAYQVLKPGNTYDEERTAPVAGKPVSEVKATEAAQGNIKEESVEKTYTFSELEELAMKFQFYNFGISMTVAQFLEKLKEQ